MHRILSNVLLKDYKIDDDDDDDDDRKDRQTTVRGGGGDGGGEWFVRASVRRIKSN